MGAIGTQTVNTTARIAALRELMSSKEHNVDALVVPSEDQRELSDIDIKETSISCLCHSRQTRAST